MANNGKYQINNNNYIFGTIKLLIISKLFPSGKTVTISSLLVSFTC